MKKKKSAIRTLIINERVKHREFLNDVLGDISPYWQKPVILSEEDLYENYYEDYDYFSSESDNDYYE